MHRRISTRLREALRLPVHSMAGRAGASFKPKHLDDILADPDPAGFFEIHAENYMGAGGPPHAAPERIRQSFPVSLHVDRRTKGAR